MPLITGDTSFCHGKRDPTSYSFINYEKSTLKSSFSPTCTEPNTTISPTATSRSPS